MCSANYSHVFKNLARAEQVRLKINQVPSITKLPVNLDHVYQSIQRGK